MTANIIRDMINDRYLIAPKEKSIIEISIKHDVIIIIKRESA